MQWWRKSSRPLLLRLFSFFSHISVRIWQPQAAWLFHTSASCHTVTNRVLRHGSNVRERYIYFSWIHLMSIQSNSILFNWISGRARVTCALGIYSGSNHPRRNQIFVQKCRKHPFSSQPSSRIARWINWRKSPEIHHSFPSVCVSVEIIQINQYINDTRIWFESCDSHNFRLSLTLLNDFDTFLTYFKRNKLKIFHNWVVILCDKNFREPFRVTRRK